MNEDDIDRCFLGDRGPLLGPEKGWYYIGAMDLGVSHDHSGVVVIGINFEEQKLKLVWMKGWAPGGTTGEVDLIDVENTCYMVNRMFMLGWFGYDPCQAKLMAQRLTRKGLPMMEVSFASPKNVTEMAQSFVQVVEAGKLECYDDEDGRLRRDFGKFSIVEKAHGGYKLEAVSDEYGHADVGTALVICMPQAVSMLAGGLFWTDDNIVAYDQEEPLTNEEIEELPDDLKGIYNAYDEMEEEQRLKRQDLDFEETWG